VWLAMWILGCGGGGSPPSALAKCAAAPGFVEEPTWFVAERAEGVRFVRVRLDAPARIRVLDDDGTTIRVLDGPTEAADHDVALVGMIEGEHELVVEVVGTQGCVEASAPHRTAVEHVVGLDVDVLELDRDAMGPEWTAVPISLRGLDREGVLLLDDQLRVVWFGESEPALRELRWTDRGTLRGTGNGRVVEIDLAAELVSEVTPEAGPLHHDVVVLPDGTFWTLVDQSTAVEAYPVSVDELDTLAPAVIRDQLVVHMDAEGRTLAARALSDVLDTRRIGYLSHEDAKEGLDWTHGNGLADDRAGGVWVSARHLDVLVHLDADLQLVELLGDPGGWVPPWSDLLLMPTAGTLWPYHTHAPEVLPDGTLVVFDNHNHGGTPYDPPDLEARTTSRAVGYRVEDGVVEQLWERSDTATGLLFSGGVGDVDVDGDGRVLADFGFVRFEDGEPLSSQGLGSMAARLVAWDADGIRRMDVRVGTDVAVMPDGLFAYRVERIPPVHELLLLERPDSAVAEPGIAP